LSVPFANLTTDVNVFPSYHAGDAFMPTDLRSVCCCTSLEGIRIPRPLRIPYQKLHNGRELTAGYLNRASILR
jgi:hypothetical protein